MKSKISVFNFIILFYLLILSCDSNEPSIFSLRMDPGMLIYDGATVLTEDEKNTLNDLLFKNNLHGSGRITVYIIEELPIGVSLDSYTDEFFKSYGVGKKEVSEQVLFLISIKDRKLRILPSKDLYNVLTTDYCKSIIDKVIVPEFKQKRYFQGIHAGVLAMIDKLKSKT